jgi:predicted MFS family arabinose efflux permease
MAGGGLLYSWLAPDAIQFIISRALVGIGYGLALMASQGFVIRYSDNNSKAQGLSYLIGGIYAGNICGAVIGAMLAEWIQLDLIFVAGAAIHFFVVVYTLIIMRGTFSKPELTMTNFVKQTKRVSKLSNFLSDRCILGLIFFSSLPASIAAVGFLNYFSPIYLNRQGIAQSVIGQVLMIYGICIIYIGPYIGKYVDASKNKNIFIFIGCLLGSLAFLCFNFLNGLAATIVAGVLLGLSNSFVLGAQSAYALKLKVTQELGEGKAIGIFRSTSRIGQMFGPIVFGWAIMANNLEQSIFYLGLCYLLTALLFIIVVNKGEERVST